MNPFNHITKLKSLPEVSLDKKALLLGKHKLLAEINCRQDARAGYILSWPEAFRFMWLRMVRKIIPAERYVVAVLLVIVVTTSSTYMAKAAVPGDVLWPLKLTYEKAEIAFATDAASEGRIHIRHADNRLKELSVVVAQPNTVQKSKNISQLVRRLEKDITAAGQSLKIAQEEKKDSAPQIIMALAQDLSDKALQAVTALNDNHTLLAADGIQEKTQTTNDSGLSATSTDSDLQIGTENASTAPTSSVPLETTESANATAATDAAKVVAEVQAINVDVSYSALKAMIEVIEGPAIFTNRDEVTRLMNQKVSQLVARLPELQENISLVNDDYILHRTELRTLLKKVTETITLADDLVKLDNLSGSFKKTQEAKDLLTRIDALLAEVASGNGFNKPKPKVEPIVQPKVAPVGQVKMQNVGEGNPEILVTE